MGGEEEDGDVPFLSDSTGRFDPVNPFSQFDVHQNNLNRERESFLDRFFTREGREHFEAGLSQLRRRGQRDNGFILYEKKGHLIFHPFLSPFPLTK